MTIPGESEDARAVRTRQQLGDALISLMKEQAFDAITVQQICERADVSRTSFYAQFQDKEEMFIRHTVVFARAIGRSLGFDAARRTYTFPATGFFEHFRSMLPVAESLARAQKLEFVLKVWQLNIAEVFEERVRETRAAQLSSSEIPVAIVALQLAATLMTLVTWWRDHHFPLSAQELSQQWERLVAGVV
jgi:AcrR family transcriptional regulator